MKTVQKYVLNYIDNVEDSENEYQNLIIYLNDQKIPNDKHMNSDYFFQNV